MDLLNWYQAVDTFFWNLFYLPSVASSHKFILLYHTFNSKEKTE